MGQITFDAGAQAIAMYTAGLAVNILVTIFVVMMVRRAIGHTRRPPR